MSSSTPNHTLIERLYAAGAHFGFKKSRRHPTVTPYIHSTKNGNDIFDLERSAAALEEAKAVLKEAGRSGKVVLFVGTKEEISRIVKEAAQKVGMPYVTDRWIGGLLTNWSEAKKRLARLEELENEKRSGGLERRYTKKERVILGREEQKLLFNFGGVVGMQKPPDLMLIVDPRHDHIAVKEARDMRIPTVALLSSDCNASLITHPVVLNDALRSSVALALNELVAALIEGVAAPVAHATAREGA